MHDNSRVLGSRLNSFLIKSVKGFSSGDPGEKLQLSAKSAIVLIPSFVKHSTTSFFQTYLTSSLFENCFTVSKTHGGNTPVAKSQV